MHSEINSSLEQNEAFRTDNDCLQLLSIKQGREQYYS